jgi:hypothetical protein
MLLYNTVFTKTTLGSDELTATPSKLTPKQRRVLIMIDGKRTVGDLAPMMAEGAIDPIVVSLIELEMIIVAGQQDLRASKPVAQAPVVEVAPVSDFASQQRLGQLRRKAIQIVEEALGPGSETICLQLERAQSLGQLLTVSEKCTDVLISVNKKSHAQKFLDEVQAQLV